MMTLIDNVVYFILISYIVHSQRVLQSTLQLQQSSQKLEMWHLYCDAFYFSQPYRICTFLFGLIFILIRIFLAPTLKLVRPFFYQLFFTIAFSEGLFYFRRTYCGSLIPYSFYPQQRYVLSCCYNIVIYISFWLVDINL